MTATGTSPLARRNSWRSDPPSAKADESRVMTIASEADIVAARKVIRDAASAVGFGLIDTTRIVTAASELSRNIYHYAQSGSMTWRTLNKAGKMGLEMIFEDHGPGIPDIEKAMEPGFTTARGMGLGLPGTKRLMDEMNIQSTPGKGTTVQIRKWLK